MQNALTGRAFHVGDCGSGGVEQREQLVLPGHQFVRSDLHDVVLSGGGARNPTLVRMIREALPLRTVRTFDELYFDGEAKEAVAFAYIALQHLRGVPGNVPAATGAAGPRILGTRTLP